MRPAVSVRGKFSSADSIYDASATSMDPIIYDDGNMLSDLDFGSLFAADSATEYDSQFFKDGLVAPTEHDDLDANGFTFDSMVDLDACQPHGPHAKGANTQYNNNNNTEDFAHSGDVFTEGRNFECTRSSHQNAASSSAQQPILGAPS